MSLMHKCAKAGCNRLIDINTRYCKQHTNYYSRQYDKQRMKNSLTHDYRLFYQSKAWRELRQEKLLLNPLCEDCLKNNKYTIATDIHHVDDVFNHWSERLNLNNLKSLCKPCHEKIHKLGYYPSR